MLTEREIIATLDMLRNENLDVRTVTLGVSLFDCASDDAGRFIDHVGTRLGMALSIVVWSVAGMLHALGGGLWSFRIFRFLLGIGEAGNWPGATKVVSEWFPARERAFAVSIFDSGSAVGGVLAPPLVAWIIFHFGWRPAFLVTGILGFLWLVLWLRIYRIPEQHRRLTQEELDLIRSDQEPAPPAGAVAVSWRALLRHRAVWGIICGRFFTDPIWWFYVYWLPKYLSDARGFSLAQIAAVAWIPFVTVDVGNLLMGWTSDRMVRRGWSVNRARKAVMVVAVCGMMAGLPAGLTDHALLSIGLIAIATLCYAGWGTMMLTLPSDLFPSKAVASAAGLGGMGAGVGGILSSWIIGRVVDRYSYQPVFVVAGLLPLVAIVLVQLLIPQIRKQPVGT